MSNHDTLTCEDCGKTGKPPEVIKTTCPYTEELYDETVEAVLCDKCLYERMASV